MSILDELSLYEDITIDREDTVESTIKNNKTGEDNIKSKTYIVKFISFKPIPYEVKFKICNMIDRYRKLAASDTNNLIYPENIDYDFLNDSIEFEPVFEEGSWSKIRFTSYKFN